MTIMAVPTINKEMDKAQVLVAEIDGCDKYLKKYRVRENLKDCVRESLVEVQMRKASLVAQVKMMLIHHRDVPQSVLKIYF